MQVGHQRRGRPSGDLPGRLPTTRLRLLLDIVLILCGLLVRILSPVPGSNFAIETLVNTIFIGLVAAVVYSVAQSLMGRYAEIPALSDAVYMQVR